MLNSFGRAPSYGISLGKLALPQHDPRYPSDEAMCRTILSVAPQPSLRKASLKSTNSRQFPLHSQHLKPASYIHCAGITSPNSKAQSIKPGVSWPERVLIHDNLIEAAQTCLNPKLFRSKLCGVFVINVGMQDCTQ